MTTYRERREAKVSRLTEWAGKRQAKANAIERADHTLREDMAFVAAQPGIASAPSWKRAMAREEKEWENRKVAASMNSRASGIVDQLERAIYDDDPDAIEQLTARIATLETKLASRKEANAKYRAEHKAELKTLTAYGRNQAVPFPSYSISNLGADIRRNKERLAKLEREAVSGETPRYLYSVKRAAPCRDCGATIEVGKPAQWFKQTGELACYPKCEEAAQS